MRRGGRGHDAPPLLSPRDFERAAAARRRPGQDRGRPARERHHIGPGLLRARPRDEYVWGARPDRRRLDLLRRDREGPHQGRAQERLQGQRRLQRRLQRAQHRRRAGARRAH